MKFNVATVTAPGVRWVKARALLTQPDDGLAIVRVEDVRRNTLIREYTGSVVVEPGVWVLTSEGGVVTVADMPGACTCGGTRTETLA